MPVPKCNSFIIWIHLSPAFQIVSVLVKEEDLQYAAFSLHGTAWLHTTFFGFPVAKAMDSTVHQTSLPIHNSYGYVP